MPVVRKKDPRREQKPVLPPPRVDDVREDLEIAVLQSRASSEPIAGDEEISLRKHEPP